MNWVNLTFYIACMVTGVCWSLWKIKFTNKLPKWLSETVIWFAEIFWVILIIFLVRSFLWEPFRIPSASMLPTLEDGDFILVNKYQYGIKAPGFDFNLTDGNPPKRGDVAVFRYPPNPTQDYIKRVIALPGDVIEYRSEITQDGGNDEIRKTLSINGKIISKELLINETKVLDNPRIKIFSESLDDQKHQMRELTHHFILSTNPSSFASVINCVYDAPIGFRCIVPEDHYFMLGDNRDESADSRYWGFVPTKNLVGKAFFVWMNFGKFSRIGAID